MNKGRDNYYKVSQNPHVLPTETNDPIMGARTLNLAEYLSAIPDQGIRNFVSELAKIKVKETHDVLDWYTKALWHLSHNCPQFIEKLTNHIRTSSQTLIGQFTAKFKSSSMDEKTYLKSYMKNNGLLGKFKPSFDKEIDFESEFTKGKPLSQQLEELRDLADYKHHQIMRKLAIKKFSPAPVVQQMKQIVKVVNFDRLHNESVNCVDICPFGKILASASNDGTIKFIDLESMKPIKELVIMDNNMRQIKSLCLDDKHNIAYVNQDNIIRIFNIEQSRVIAEYKGEKMMDITDSIPNQACQFTSDYNYLAFRSGGKKIVLFDMYSKAISKEYTSTELINDFTISPQRDYLATAIYADCKTEILSVSTGEKIAEFKTDSKNNHLSFRSSFHRSMG